MVRVPENIAVQFFPGVSIVWRPTCVRGFSGAEAEHVRKVEAPEARVGSIVRARSRLRLFLGCYLMRPIVQKWLLHRHNCDYTT
jgi:hypothetical protein